MKRSSSVVVRDCLVMDTSFRGALHDWVINTIHRSGISDSDSVSQWLTDLRQATDMECMCVLQGKSLTKESTDLVFSSVKTTKHHIDSIKGRAHVISSEFTKLFRRVEKERWKHARSCGLRVVCQIRSLIHECASSMGQVTPQFTIHQQRVMEECARLAQFIEGRLDGNVQPSHKLELLKMMSSLAQLFSSLVDLVLSHHLQNLLKSICEPQSPYALKSALNHVVSLGLEGDHMCYLITKEGAVDQLFNICSDPLLQYAHSQALRAIATICCIPDGIYQLEMAGGIEMLTELLGSDRVPENVRAEAAGVVAQITSPCLEQFHHLSGFIENMQDLVRSLTVLCVEASGHEVFLLGCAALANMTFMDSMACEFLSHYSTACVLIEACTLNKAHSLFAKDQVATVLANMAAIEACCSDITENRGVELLVHFLYEQPLRGGATVAELSACERVQQKAAIALTRLCRDQEVAQIVVELEGLERLVQLCREPLERNHSDAVLVACLAALRKVCSVCGLEKHMSSDLQQLTQPKLMDSFLLCSNLDESAV